MARENTAEKTAVLKPIENFCTDRAIHNAVCAMKGWAEGKEVTEAEYKAAVNDFLHAPMGSFRETK